MLKNKTILVTGCCGFIGSHLVEELLNQEVNVIGTDIVIHGINLIPNEIVHRVKMYYTDITNVTGMDKIFKENEIDYIVHLGALANVSESIDNPNLYYEANVCGSLNIMHLSKKYQVKKIIVASSSSVYGNSKKVSQAEYNELKPLSPYAETKYLVERLSDVYSQYLSIVNLRFFNVWGTRQIIHGEGAVIPSFIKGLVNNCMPTIYGSGKQYRDFVHVKDVVQAIILALRSPARHVKLNVGSGIPISIDSLYGLICKQMGIKKRPIRKKKRPGDVDNSCANIELVQETIGFYPKYNLEKDLKEVIEYYKGEKC